MYNANPFLVCFHFSHPDGKKWENKMATLTLTLGQKIEFSLLILKDFVFTLKENAW